jgi:hypothetical protein
VKIDEEDWINEEYEMRREEGGEWGLGYETFE